MLRQIVTRYNGEVNGYFLCDRGRYGYEFVNSNRRIRQPQLSGTPMTIAEASLHLDGLVAGGSVIGIGSPRASLESNFALAHWWVRTGSFPGWTMIRRAWLVA